MAIPDFQTLMLSVLQAASQGEVKTLDLIDRLAETFALSEEDRTTLVPSGKQTTLANRANWAKTYLAKAGLIEATGRGRFKISDDGRQVLANPPERISIKYLERFPSFREFQSRSRVNGEETSRDEAERSRPLRSFLNGQSSNFFRRWAMAALLPKQRAR